mgnify:CR=1 FL=1
MPSDKTISNWALRAQSGAFRGSAPLEARSTPVPDQDAGSSKGAELLPGISVLVGLEFGLGVCDFSLWMGFSEAGLSAGSGEWQFRRKEDTSVINTGK